MYNRITAFFLFFFPLTLLAQRPSICTTSTPGITVEPTGLTLTANNVSTHGCKDFGQTITLNAIDATEDPTITFLFDAKQNATLADINELSASRSLDVQGEIWVISKRLNPSSSGGHIIKCASIEIIETKKPNFEFTICGNLLSEGNAVVTLNTPTNSNVNITHRIQSIPIFGNHPSNITNTFTEEELQNNGNKRSINLNINQPNPIIVPILTTFFSKRNPALSCTGNRADFEANQTQKPIRITEIATNDNKKSVSLKLEHQKENSSYKIDYRKFNENSYLTYGAFTSPNMVFSLPGALIPQNVSLDRIDLDPTTSYCFYAWEDNVCSLPNVPSPPIKSNEVCTILLDTKFASGNENQYRLRHDWNVSTPNTTKIISTEIKDLNGGFGTPVFPSSAIFQESVFPSNCTETSTYQVVQLLLETNSTGATFDVTVLSNAIPLQDIRIAKPTPPLLVSFAQNGSPEVDLTILDIPANNLYEVFFTTDQSDTKISLGESSSISQKHTNLSNPSDQYCYEYVQKICGQISPPSDLFCTIKSELAPDEFILNWSDFEPKPATSLFLYDIEWVDEEVDSTFQAPISLGSPTSLLEADLESILRDNPDVNQALVRVFTRQAPSLGGNSGVSYSYPIRLIRPLSLIFPTAFTPNNDDINDVFKPASRVRQVAELQIYNRLGHLVYKTSDVNQGWNGTNFQGIKLEKGMYTYIVQVTDEEGLNQTQEGNVLLLY